MRIRTKYLAFSTHIGEKKYVPLNNLGHLHVTMRLIIAFGKRALKNFIFKFRHIRKHPDFDNVSCKLPDKHYV